MMIEHPFDNRVDTWPLDRDFDRFDALFFDLDGTLVETMSLHGRAYAEVFASYGYKLELADYLALVGPPARVAIPLFAAAAGVSNVNGDLILRIHAEKKRRFSEILAIDSPQALAATGLLKRYKCSKPLALVSSGNRDGVEAILRAMGWNEMFDAVISGDDVSQGKPHSEPYLTAAQAIGVLPARCIAFEDTEAGVRSALAAGMNVVDVTLSGAIHTPGAGR